ncbi:hypothetical protein FB561_1591 [Kribbella amoyensis]|uniref:Uncharacterized protein n=1 Tax=Kribbella amoyensis TaxID=996641 RepID=A0A561BNX4_9ACTN|nr:hypothetical protein [Kribbella amoyensis]TWD80513.1 hypothetical protein FB561_1591 [Kribbella amoyensis]
MASAAPDPDKAQRTFTGLLWTCSVLCLLIALFLASDIAGSHQRYGGLAWVGVVVAAAIVLGLAVVYAACATGRLKLSRIVVGSLTVFHVTTLAVVAAVGADILIPDRDTGALALLLPWGITYWLHNLKAKDT